MWKKKGLRSTGEKETGRFTEKVDYLF